MPLVISVGVNEYFELSLFAKIDYCVGMFLIKRNITFSEYVSAKLLSKGAIGVPSFLMLTVVSWCYLHG